MDRRKFLESRIDQCKLERATYEDDWQDITDAQMAHRPRWDISSTTTHESKSKYLINSTPERSRRIFCAGMIASVTSPSREWFNLTTSDPEANEMHAVREYLSDVERIIREHLAKGKFYQALSASIYPDIALISTACMLAEEREGYGLAFPAFVPGEYWIDVGHDDVVDTLFVYRMMTVKTLVSKFGYENCSENVRNDWNRGNYNNKRPVWRAVYPNDNHKPNKLNRDGKRWLSDWWEEDNKKGWLRQSGYEDNPIVAPRWISRSGDAYGTGSPGYESRGDCKMIQEQEISKLKLVDKITDPALKASEGILRASLIPGEITYVGQGSNPILEPIQKIDPAAIRELREEITTTKLRIEQAFFVDLWLSILNDPRQQRPTATEVTETKQEVMLQLGPLLDSLNSELLEPTIMRSYSILERQGLLPEPPEEVQGGELKIEFISIMHQAQKLTGLSGIRELISAIQELAAIGKMDALDKLNSDAIVDEITDMLGVRPELVLSEDKVAEVRQAKAERQQAQDQGQAMLAATEGMRNLSQSEPQKIADIAGMMSPVASAQGGLK